MASIGDGHGASLFLTGPDWAEVKGEAELSERLMPGIAGRGRSLHVGPSVFQQFHTCPNTSCTVIITFVRTLGRSSI
jgi:hypothetical protein